MRLGEFIRERSADIIAEWEAFASTLAPAGESMSPHFLRNHIGYILEFIADDIDTAQSDAEQVKKSKGENLKPADSVAEVHAALRHAGGFDMDQMVSEYRALRASVIKLWLSNDEDTSPRDMLDLIRFNEAIDQELTESISYYTSTVEHSRSLFLGILGHDLRNPIGAMTMAAQLIERIGSLSDRQKMLVAQISTSGDRALEMLDQLADLTRVRIGSGLRIIRQEMDMAFVGRLLVDEMRAAHPERTFVVEVSGDTQGEFDRPRIGQVFSNLLGNAAQYGFADLPIKTTIRGVADYVTIAVHNYGKPIPEKALGGMFDALVRSDKDHNGQHGSVNLGLGLYISKQIILAHGGTIKAESSEKDGTTFTACFPRQSDEDIHQQVGN